MDYKMKILFLTTFEPREENKGQPSILSKLIYDSLRYKYKENVDLKVIDLPKNKFLKKIYQLYFYGGEKIKGLDNYDLIYLYPYWCINNIDSKFNNKINVIAPDLQSTLFSRMSKVQESKIKSIFYNLLSVFLTYRETVLSNVNKVFFVGQSDTIDFLLNTSSDNSEYIPHPMLLNSQGVLNIDQVKKKDLILISGAGGCKYYGNLLDRFLNELSILSPQTDIMITGKENKIVAERYKNKLVKLQHIDFVDNYGELFSSNNVVHVSPLIVGAGTKNRILDALSKGAVCVTTEIGGENLHEFFDTGALQVTSKPSELAILALSSFNSEIEWSLVYKILNDRNSRFKGQLLK